MNKKDHSGRNFIMQNTLAGPGIINMCSIAGCAVSKISSANPGIKDLGINTISDLNPEQLRKRYKETLFGKFIPNKMLKPINMN
jgi:hypothetical protein